jgi:hypothetical protein
MTTQKVQVDVTKEGYELMQGVAKFVGALALALKDGWQMGSDLPVVVAATLGDLVPALQGVEKLPAEAVGETGPFAMGMLVGVADIVKAVRGGK